MLLRSVHHHTAGSMSVCARSGTMLPVDMLLRSVHHHAAGSMSICARSVTIPV
jgi:hypothetical protein